jgi:hypothetical protein
MNTATLPIEIVEHKRPGQYIDILAYKVTQALGGKIHKSGIIYLQEELHGKFQKDENGELSGYGIYYIQLNYKDASQMALILDKGHQAEILGTRVIKHQTPNEEKFHFKNQEEKELIQQILSELILEI